jgi:hypothetical protein
MVASAGAIADISALPESSDECYLQETGGEKIRYRCGHSEPSKFKIFVYGIVFSPPDGDKYCPECWLKRIKWHVIRCASCGLPILPGEPVALYSWTSRGLRFRQAAARHKRQYIGCMRWDCCPSGAFFSGYWSEKGFVPLFDGKTMAEETLATGREIAVDSSGDKIN